MLKFRMALKKMPLIQIPFWLNSNGYIIWDSRWLNIFINASEIDQSGVLVISIDISSDFV